MIDDTSPRLAGSVLIAGAALMFVGAAVPLFTDLGLEAWTADWEARLELISASPTAWRVANALLIGGAVVTVVGSALTANLFRLLGLTAEAAAAVALFPVGVALEAVNRTSNMTVAVWAAEAKATDDPLFRVFEGIDAWRALLGDLFLVLAAASLVVIGVGFWRARRRPLGAIVIGFGVVALATGVFSELVPTVVFLGTGAVGVGLILDKRLPQA